MYQIKTDDLYRDLRSKEDLHRYFDFSNYSVDNPLYSNENRMKVLLFKDELGGRVVDEFIALRPKAYSLSTLGNS